MAKKTVSSKSPKSVRKPAVKKSSARARKAATKPSARGRKPDPPDKQTIARARRLQRGLARLYPDAHCELDYESPFQLLVATILSAQCTDVRVNMVTPEVFRKYSTPKKLADADQGELEDIVRSTGFFRNKAKALRAAAQGMVDHHNGQVPDRMDALLELRGVARKTANVVLGNSFDKNEGVVVDTHVRRLANRMGLTAQADPEIIEQDLMALFPRKTWTMLSHLLIWHGRRVCNARKPDCDNCALAKDCPRIDVESA